MKVKLSMNYFSVEGVMLEARDESGTRIIHNWPEDWVFPTDTLLINDDGSETPVGKQTGRTFVDRAAPAAEPTTFSEITKVLTPDDPSLAKSEAKK